MGDTAGKQKILNEDTLQENDLQYIEEVIGINFNINEEESILEKELGKGGKLVAEGEFGRCDVPTANGRVYGRKIYEKQVNKLQTLIKERQLLGELDHPADGKTSLKRVSHVITKLWIEEDGRVMGRLEVLPTRDGLQLASLIRSNIKVGVSSRGFGTVTKDGQGRSVVGENFMLKTFDVVEY